MRIPLLILASSLALTACTEAGDDASTSDTGMAAPSTSSGEAQDPGATVVMRDTAGRELGTLTLADGAAGIAVAGTLRGLSPGEHGFHVHTTGRCEPTFDAAGGHWNPAGRQHGSENPEGPHFGDMPNIIVGSDSSVSLSLTTPGGTIRGENTLLDADGAAVMVHAGADDLRSDPAGDAGGRIACGVVSGR